MKKIKELCLAHQEIISYLFFGVATTVINWLSYALTVGVLGMAVTPGNIISWFVAVLFAFVTNKLWVFNSKSWAWPLWLKEAGTFFGSRVFTGLVEIVGVPLLIKLGLDMPLFGVEGFAAKLIVSVVVIVLNYIFSKFLIFRKKA